MCRIAQGAYYVGYRLTHIQGTQLLGRQAHHLDHQSNGSLVNVGTGNGQRHTLSTLINAYNDKIAGLAAFGN